MRRFLSILVLILLGLGATVWTTQASKERSNGRFLDSISPKATVEEIQVDPIISGTSQKWHPLTFSFAGLTANETDNSPNPFLDYRFTMIFTAPSGRQIQVPGFFDGDGQGNGNGNTWRVRFAPDEIGVWNYTAFFRQGTDVAINLDENAGTPTSFNNSTGTFTINTQDCLDSGFLKWGRLEYVDKHYLKFNDGPYWLKGGTNSPENLFGYRGFDNTIDQGGMIPSFLHEYPGHVADWQPGDPNFVSADTGYDGKGLLGALNYLSAQHINSIYFIPMNLGGDGQETYPFISPTNDSYAKTHYDISKLSQWNIVLEHAQQKGIAIHMLLAETELPNEQWLDNGTLGVQRKLFYRELIARFGYLLALKWNLSEENDYPTAQLQQFADYIQALDWNQHPIGVHTHLNDESYYHEIKGDVRFTATSFQYDNNDAALTNNFVESWRQISTQAGRPWIIDMDENFNSLVSWNEDLLRKTTLYPVYFSGGNIEWYLGYHKLPLGGDLRLENFRTREQMWKFNWYARKFMLEHLPFWEMEPKDHLLQGETTKDWGNGQVFAKTGEIYALYIPYSDGKGVLDFQTENGAWLKRWYDPRTGNFVGASTNVQGGGQLSIGYPPHSNKEDWVVLLEALSPNVTTSSPFWLSAEFSVFLPMISKTCPQIIE